MSEDAPTKDPTDLVVGTADRELVRIKADGRIIYGPEYTPDEAAVEFWTQMSQRRLESEERLIQLGAMEQLIMAVGKADLTNEAAQRKSRALGASDLDKFAAERTNGALESAVHQLIEFARGLILPPSAQN